MSPDLNSALRDAVDWPVLIERLGWTLVHSIWQFALVAGVLGLTLRVMTRASSRARYAASVLAMAAMLSCATVGWLSSYDASSQGSNGSPAGQKTAGNDPGSAAKAPKKNAQPEVAAIGSTPTGGVGLRLWRKALEPWLGTIVTVWVFGVVLFAGRLMLSSLLVRRLRFVGRSPVTQRVSQLFQNTVSKVGLRHAVALAQSELIKGPAVVGFFRPIVLIPMSVACGFPPEQLEAIFAHELAHIRRHDYLINLLQTIIETVFFYHPAIWWVSNQVRRERENCCDDVALAVCSSRSEYAKALLALEGLRAPIPLTALAASGGSLLERIRRIAGVVDEPRPGLGAVVFGGTLLASLAIAGFSSRTPQIPAAVISHAYMTAPRHAVSVSHGARVVLDDGAIIDFLGLRVLQGPPSGWWGPEGGTLSKPPESVADPIPQFPPFPKTLIVREFALDASVDADSEWHFAEFRNMCLTQWIRYTEDPIGDSTHRKDRYIVSICHDEKTAIVGVDYCTGPWKMVQPHIGSGGLVLQGAVVFLKASSPSDARERYSQEAMKAMKAGSRGKKMMPYVSFAVTTDAVAPVERNYRMVAIDKDGHEHVVATVPGPASPIPNLKGPIAFGGVCWDLPREDVKEFRFQVGKPMRRIEFRNVPLYQSQETNFDVTVDGKRYDPKPAT